MPTMGGFNRTADINVLLLKKIFLFLLPCQAPALLVSLMGVFLLVKLVYGVVTFASFPEEAVALQQVGL